MRQARYVVCSLGVLAMAALAPSAALAGASGGEPEIIVKYSAGNDFFQLDENANFVWDGGGGGDSTTIIAPGAGAGTPFVGDDGELCKSVASQVFCDRNKNGSWDGNAGGDFSTNFSPGSGTGIFLFADTSGNGVAELVKYVPDIGGSGTDAYLVDLNENGIWDGAGGGDATYFVAPGQAPAVPFACDCDGNGTIELGKYIEVGSLIFVDTNNNGAWNGNAGGDNSSAFAASQNGIFTFGPVVSGSSRDALVKYYGDFSGGGTDLFQIDTNNNFLVWDGGAADDNALVAPGQNGGEPHTIDLTGTGTAVLMKTIGATSSVFVDANGNLGWDGNAGGDSSSTFSPGSGAGVFVVIPLPPQS